MIKLAVACAAVTFTAVVPANSAPQMPLDRAPLAAILSTAFPNLTTIYYASGVLDSGALANEGNATVVHCSNISGKTAQLRLLYLQR